MQITNWLTGAVIFEAAANTVKELVEAAIKARANLEGANLEGANLVRANLVRANLEGANLVRAKIDDNLTIVSHLQVGPVGSRNAPLLALLLSDSSIQIRTGCFCGSLDKFQDAVQRTHADNKYGQEYRALVVFIQAWALLHAPKPDAE